MITAILGQGDECKAAMKILAAEKHVLAARGHHRPADGEESVMEREAKKQHDVDNKVGADLSCMSRGAGV